MTFLIKLLEILQHTWTVPKSYGVFHLVSVALFILLGVLLCLKFKNPSPKTVRWILYISASVVILLEIYKQVVFSFWVDGSTIVFDYQWYAFPFQFCSMPMYIGMLAVLVQKESIHRALCAFLGTYAFFAGIGVMAYPEQVFVDIVGINLQTMICHGTMLSIGIFLLFSGYVKLKHRTILPAMAVFSCCVLVAVILNEGIYYSGLLNGETFNMFFVSRHFAPSLPVYSLVQAVVPYPFCLVIYILGFSLAAYLILLICMGLKALMGSIFKRKKTATAE